jgi:hypothetical protein
MQKYYLRSVYPVEYFNPHVQLEYDIYNDLHLDCNEAEIKALQHDEYKNKYEEMKKLKNDNYNERFNKNALLYEEELKMKNKEEEISKRKEDTEKLLKKQNFNQTVFNNNMKQFSQRNFRKANTLDKDRNIKNKYKEIKVLNHYNQDINTYNAEDDLNSHKKLFVPKKTFLKGEASDQFLSDDNGDDEGFNKYFDDLNLNQNNEFEEKMKSKNILNNNIVDLRGDIEEELLKELKNKNRHGDNFQLKNEINDKISNIKRFRSHGVLPERYVPISQRKPKMKKKTKKFYSEFERKRFIKALKHIITERLGAHDIYIQNICSCGNLQRQLTALVEQGNLTVYALTDVECANNCEFYKNKKAYLKNINDVLKSIKDISYENFHNKYKDKI